MDWVEIEFPWVAMTGDYARLKDGRYIVMAESKRFESEEDCEAYVVSVIDG